MLWAVGVYVFTTNSVTGVPLDIYRAACGMLLGSIVVGNWPLKGADSWATLFEVLATGMGRAVVFGTPIAITHFLVYEDVYHPGWLRLGFVLAHVCLFLGVEYLWHRSWRSRNGR